MKTFSYTVHASDGQRERWEAAAVAHGRMTVGSWLAQAADAYLEKMAQSGKRLPLHWRRGKFRARIYNLNVHPNQYQEVEVRGTISGRFGIFPGTVYGQGNTDHAFCLTHIPTRRIIACLTYQRACKAFAAELVYLWVNWDQEDPEKVLPGSPEQPTAATLLHKYRHENDSLRSLR
jgi:hypothetical protein